MLSAPRRRRFALPEVSQRWQIILGIAMVVVLGGGALTIAILLPRGEENSVALASLPVDKPILKEIRGAQVYFLRQPDGEVIALWGISPIIGDANKVQCFIQDRAARTFRGVSGPLFVDPCRGAWWGHDGRFLGYADDPSDTMPPAPPLVRIPTIVTGTHVELDLTRLNCLQSRTC